MWWKHVDKAQRGRVNLEDFCSRMADRPQELAWETNCVEELAEILRTKRDALKRVFNLEGQILSRGEFRESLIRLGLGISSKQAGDIFDRVDVESDGAIDVKEFIAFVNGTCGATQPSILNDLIKKMRLHMGSAEGFYLWILKKCKLDPHTRAISDVHFATGVRELVALCPLAPRTFDERDVRAIALF